MSGLTQIPPISPNQSKLMHPPRLPIPLRRKIPHKLSDNTLPTKQRRNITKQIRKLPALPAQSILLRNRHPKITLKPRVNATSLNVTSSPLPLTANTSLHPRITHNLKLRRNNTRQIRLLNRLHQTNSLSETIQLALRRRLKKNTQQILLNHIRNTNSRPLQSSHRALLNYTIGKRKLNSDQTKHTTKNFQNLLTPHTQYINVPSQGWLVAMNYVVVTGGVLSGLGKGVTVASIGRILKDRGYNVAPIKIDGYVNVDPGTMNPYEHGEVYVLEDGSETDLDLGHYERFLNVDLTGESSITTGLVYQTVIDKERRGDYLGKTVQVIPHITDEIKKRIKRLKDGIDVVLIEVGGTVGDMENRVFIEALRQLAREKDNKVVFVHLSYVPVILSGEQKTKPTQHSVKELLSLGIQPDIIIGRSEKELAKDAKRKIALFCGVAENDVFSNPDIDDIYCLPLVFNKQNVGDNIIEKLCLKTTPKSSSWEKLIEKIREPKEEVNIAVIGKYTGLIDAYLSIKEAFKHAAVANNCKVKLTWIEAEEINGNDISDFDGVLVPGGFGSRGVEGKINAIQKARENEIPFLGICFGMQLAVVEYARNILGLKKAASTEETPDTPDPVVDFIPEQKTISKKGATMRLGSQKCLLKKGSMAAKLYGAEEVNERHRHRYEINPTYIQRLEEAGLVFSGKHSEKDLMEIVEITNHPYFMGCQFHPEFKSRLEKPAPLFVGLVAAALKRKKNKTTKK
ncbi:CTP synthase [uncultured archaeon]|nr:CTP synthase [uncultured archaeon]